MKKILFVFIGVLVIICVIVAAIGKFMLNVAIRPESQRRFQLDSCYTAVYHSYPEMEEWYDSLQTKGNWRDTILLDENGLRHHAVVIEHDSLSTGSTIVLHGYDDNSVRMMRYAYMHYEVLQRNVIVPDHYFHGESDGDHIRFGWLDRLDVTGLWIPLAHCLWPDEQMVVHGLSMGGALTMFTSGEDIPDSLNLIGFIEDCGFSSIHEQLEYQLNEEFGLPAWPILNVASEWSALENGWSFEDGNALTQLEKCERPMLFIHGDADSFVPTWMVHENYEAKTKGYKELWIVSGADHAESIHLAWDEYCAHCKDYIEKISSL